MKIRFKHKKLLIGLSFVMPSLIYLIIIYGGSIINAIKESIIISDKTDIIFGIQNYIRILRDTQFINSIKVSLYFVFGSLIPIWIISFIFALILVDKLKFKNIYLAIMFIPVAMDDVVAGVIWRLSYLPNYGFFAKIFNTLNLDELASIQWLTDHRIVMPALIIFHIWKGVGLYTAIFLGGLQSIPNYLYEAAALDCNNKFKILRHVTLPFAAPTILFVILISTGLVFGWFTPMFVMTAGGPNAATRVLPMYIFEQIYLYGKLGIASAGSVILFFGLLIFSISLFRLFQKVSYEE